MKTRKGLSLLLVVSMIAGMMASVTAFAADPQLIVKAEGSSEILATYDANSSGSYSAKTDIESYEFSNGLGNTSGPSTSSSAKFSIGSAAVDVSMTTNKSISWTISGATEDIFLTLDLADPDQYTINATSDTLDANDNTGVDGEATCDVSKTMSTADFGDSVSVTFTPMPGQSIVKLNIRSDEDDVNLFEAKNQTVQVGNSTYGIICQANGKVIVTNESVTENVYVTALTKPAGDFTLYVDHDPHCAANVSTLPLDTLKSQDIRLTPDKNYDIATIQITDGDYTETLTRSYTTAHINGKNYKAVWNLNGTVTLTVPAATADVTMYVASAPSDNSYYVQATPVTNVTVNCENPLYYQPSEKARIILTPDKDTGIVEFKVSNGAETVTVSPTNKTFMLGGVSHTVSVSSSGVVTVTITPGVGNIQLFDIETDRNAYTVKVSADSGISVSKASQSVNVGKTATITFTPKKNYGVGEISVTRNGRTYTADAQDDSYINVNGVRCPITMASNGKVTLTLNQVTANLTVYAESIYTGDYDYEISVSSDSGLTHSVSKAYVYEGDDCTITFTPDSTRYDVTEITIKRNGKTYTVDPSEDDYVTIAGTKCPITVSSKGVVKLVLKDIDADMTVKAESTYTSKDYVMKEDGHVDISYNGTLKYGNTVTFTIKPDSGYEIKSVKVNDGESTKTLDMDSDSFTMNGKRYTVTTKSNGTMTIKVSLPSELTITASTNNDGTVIVSGTHPAYINGYADGTFRPDNTITRGAAIAMLARQYSGMNDAQLAVYANYRYADVPNTHVFAGAIGWAASRGYLNCIVTNNQLKPAQAITRAEFVALLCEFENASVKNASKSNFSDVSKNYWAVDEIEYATSQGWIYGYSNGSFRPDSSITRAEIVTIINRVLGRSYQNEVRDSVSVIRSFSDVPSSYWAYYDIMEASSTHYVVSER